MTPQMQAALAQRQLIMAGLIRITLPDYTLRLCDGALATWGAEVFLGRDDRYGAIGAIDVISETVGDQMPGMRLSLLPPSTTAAIDLATADDQGAPVRVYLAVIDAATGAVIPDPELLYAGEVDVSELELDRGSRTLNMTIASVWQRLLEPNEGAALSDAFHQSIWPGELGFENMTGTVIKKLWGPGEKPPAAALVPQLPTGGVQRYL